MTKKKKIPIAAKIIIILSFIPSILVLFGLGYLGVIKTQKKHNTYGVILKIENIEIETVQDEDVIYEKEAVATCKIRKIVKSNYQKSHIKDNVPHIDEEIRIYDRTIYDGLNSLKKGDNLELYIEYKNDGTKEVSYPSLSFLARYPKYKIIDS